MTLSEAISIIGGPLSEASKMPCHVFSLPTSSCKRGSVLRNLPGSVCSKCYAQRGHFCYAHVQHKLNDKLKAINHPLWAQAMVLVLWIKERSGFFRWFSSGDLQSIEHLRNICKVARSTPHIQHWLATREVGALRGFFRQGYTLPDNLTVRLSSDFFEEKPNLKDFEKFGIVGSSVSQINFNCPASTQGNNCKNCRMCWDKKVKIVTYKRH